MISEVLTNTAPDTFDGVIGTVDLAVITPPLEDKSREVCICSVPSCDYEELAFYKTAGETWQNDTTTVISETYLASDSHSFKLYKDGVLQATISDSSYGTFVAVGGYTDQPKVTTFIADWLLIATAFGDGVYHIASDRTIVNQNKVATTHNYRVTEYSNEKAKGTVVIKSTQNGIIQGGFNYIDVDITQAVRIKGHLSGTKRTKENNRYLSQNLTLEQIQEDTLKSWSLETGLIPTNIATPLLDDKLMGNSIKITNYGVNEFDNFIDLEVVNDDIEGIYFAKNINGVFKLEFSAYRQNLRKRNFI